MTTEKQKKYFREDEDRHIQVYSTEVQQLVHMIIEDNPDKSFNIVFDIGCGYGSITQYLKEQLNCQYAFGIDIDKAKIDYAKRKYCGENMRYDVVDITKPWDELSHYLKELQGKVSIAFCNHLLCALSSNHNKRQTAIDNISRLLMTNGQIYCNTCVYYDGYKANSLRQIYFYYKNVKSVQQQCQDYKKLLKNSAFIITTYGLIQIKTKLSKPYVQHIIEKCTNYKNDICRNGKIESKFWLLYWDNYLKDKCKESDEIDENGHNKVQYTIDRFTFIAYKSTIKNNKTNLFRFIKDLFQ